MKCELCHKNDAETAIHLNKDGADEELYVCGACAKEARARRQKKSQRTRKISGPGVEMTVTEIGPGAEPPQFLKALVNAFGEIMSGGRDKDAGQKSEGEKPEMKEFPLKRVPPEFRIGGGLHLEGLYLIGEMEAVRRAFKALRMQIVGTRADGLNDTGHVYRVMYEGGTDRAKRAVEDLLAQERNARIRLYEEMPRVFGDALCRALAVLKNCRLLSPGELFDLLSPLRLAAIEKMLDGISRKTIETMMSEANLSSSEDSLDPAERDKIDAERADRENERFEDVVLNERAEEKFL